MGASHSPLDCFEAVYYSQQVPSSLATLTLLALIFDRVYFPGVFLPDVELNEAALRDEINRIKGLGSRGIEDVQVLQCTEFALHVQHVRDFCIFSGEPSGLADAINQANVELMMQLEELMFGPPPPGSVPLCLRGSLGGFAKGLPAAQEWNIRAQVSAPSWLTYPAYAFVFACARGLPVLNDNPNLPVPGIGSALDVKRDVKALATIMALESLRLVLPEALPILQPHDLREFRRDLEPCTKPFRLKMLRLAKELDAAIQSNAPLSEVQQHARFLAETTVFPEISEMEKFMRTAQKPWTRRAVDLVKCAPELAVAFVTLPKHIAVAKVLGKFAEALADLRDEQLDKENRLGRGGLHYLLKIKARLGYE